MNKIQSSKSVCAVVVTFNGVQWIDDCIKSLKNSVHPVDIIIIDNGSTDSTIERITKYEKVTLIQNSNNLGFGMANNIGIKKAMENNYEYIFLLNQDARVQPKTIEILVQNAENFLEYGILSPMHLNRDGTALDYQFSTYIDSINCPGLLSDIFLEKEKNVYSIEMVNAAAWMVRSTIFKDVGFFDDLFFMYGEDDNFADRVKYKGHKIGVTPKTSIYHDSAEKRFKRSTIRLHYPTQLKRMKRIILNPNNDILEKYFYLFRKTMSDVLTNLHTGHPGAVAGNLKTFFIGIYYSLKYHKRYK